MGKPEYVGIDQHNKINRRSFNTTSNSNWIDHIKSVLADLAGQYSPTIARLIRGGQATRADLIELLNTLRVKNAISAEDKGRILSNLQEVHQAIRANRSGSASMQRTKSQGVMDQIKKATTDIAKTNSVQQAISNAEDIAQRIGSELTEGQATQVMKPYLELIEERIK